MSSLTVTIGNIEKEEGQIIISIFDNEDDFPIKGKEMKFVVIENINKSDTSVKIDLPAGEYAIALLHDLNLDWECNFNWIGIPTEGYGFSQNVRPIIKVPGFNETKFLLDGELSMEIDLIQ